MTQEEALTILKTGGNVFLTGEPGSGKTHTVNRYVAYLREHGIEPSITASTGIAATHIGGYTIHSWSGIGIKRHLDQYELDRIASNKRVYGRVGRARILIIDEVSMLSSQTLSMVEAVCREIRRDSRPFGGLQTVLVGDFFQLPPVNTRERDISAGPQRSFSGDDATPHFAFVSPVWQKANLLICYLSEQHRQEDSAFLNFLAAVRRGSADETHKALLRTRYAKTPHGGMTQLYSHNADVDRLNAAKLVKLPGQPRVFVMEGHGPDRLVSSLTAGCLSPETLSLKIGARVMFTKNDVERRFVNGTVGIVTGFSKGTPVPSATAEVRGTAGFPVIKTDSGRTVVTEPMEWNLTDGGRVLARIVQVPLRLAWAITVHKSQGMSLDCAHMNLADCFEYGQGYVALSRVRTLKGLSLAGLNARALEVHPEIKEKDGYFRSVSNAVREKFNMLERAALENMHANFIAACGGRRVTERDSDAPENHRNPGARLKRTPEARRERRWEKTVSLLNEGKSIKEVAHLRGRSIATIIEHLEALARMQKLSSAGITHIKPEPERFTKIQTAFRLVQEKTGERYLSPVRELLGEGYSYDELRLARLFLSEH